jgi:hypothetical protein
MPIATVKPPVIILGMHRSGTSMISQLLDDLGMFVGRELQEDHESTFFLSINEIIFDRVHAYWDNPLPVRDFLAHRDAAQMTIDALSADLTSSRIRDFLGAKNYRRSRGLAGFDQVWGWKDPRTIFTLPMWLEIFPGARLVYIVRHGVDVAASLRVRELRELKRYRERFQKRLTSRTLKSRLEYAGYKGSARCLSLDGGFALWEEYVTEAERNLSATDNPKLVLRYEDFLDAPAKHLVELAAFCQLPNVTDEVMQKTVQRVSTDRARRFSGDRELSAFYEKIKRNAWMTHYRY